MVVARVDARIGVADENVECGGCKADTKRGYSDGTRQRFLSVVEHDTHHFCVRWMDRRCPLRIRLLTVE
jgi:hypothetical protein